MVGEKLAAQDDKLSVQCEEDGAGFLCHQYVEVFTFRPLPQDILIEGYQNPYVASYDAVNFILIDKQDICFSERGCSAFNYQIKDGVGEKGLPFVDVICSGKAQDNVFECETKSHYFDRL